MLSEYAPWVLSDYLSIEPTDQFPNLALSWMLLNAHVLFTDDMLDLPVLTYRSELLLSSSLVFQRSLHLMSQLLPDHSAFEAVNKYLTETADAAAIELNQRRSHAVLRGDLIRPGQKIAFLKICAEIVSVHAGRGPLTKSIQQSLDMLTDGLQIVDDILDWREDAQAGHLSSLTLSTQPDVPTLEDLDLCFLASLISTEVLEHSINRALDYFGAFIDNKRDASRNLVQHVAETRIRITNIKTHCSTIRKTLAELGADVDKSLIDYTLKQEILSLDQEIRALAFNSG